MKATRSRLIFEFLICTERCSPPLGSLHYFTDDPIHHLTQHSRCERLSIAPPSRRSEMLCGLICFFTCVDMGDHREADQVIQQEIATAAGRLDSAIDEGHDL